MLFHESEELVRVARLGNYVEVGPLEQAREAFSQKDVVVGQDDACSAHARLLVNPAAFG